LYFELNKNTLWNHRNFDALFYFYFFVILSVITKNEKDSVFLPKEQPINFSMILAVA